MHVLSCTTALGTCTASTCFSTLPLSPVRMDWSHLHHPPAPLMQRQLGNNGHAGLQAAGLQFGNLPCQVTRSAQS